MESTLCLAARELGREEEGYEVLEQRYYQVVAAADSVPVEGKYRRQNLRQ